MLTFSRKPKSSYRILIFTFSITLILIISLIDIISVDNIVKIETVIIFAILFGMIASIPNIFIPSVFAAASEKEVKGTNTADKVPNTQTHKLSSDNKDNSENKAKNKDKVDTGEEKKSDKKDRHHARHIELEGSKTIGKISKNSPPIEAIRSTYLMGATTAEKIPSDKHNNQKDDDRSNYKKSNKGNGADKSEVKDANTEKNINSDSRNELLDKVSTPEELLNILSKFKDFIDDYTPVASTTNNTTTSSAYSGKVNSIPTRSYVVSYSWEPQDKITKEKYSILMLKFTDPLGNIIRNKGIDYNIMIRDSNSNIIFQKQGSTPTGVDLKVIDENTFPIGGSAFNPTMYNLQINVNAVVDGKSISEHAFLPSVAVVSKKT